MLWQVVMTELAEAEFRLLVHTKQLSKLDIRVLRRWVDEMEEFGPNFIQESPSWHDHSLEREWEGYRSSAFSTAGRIVYRIFESKIRIEVCRVTPDHNYKGK